MAASASSLAYDLHAMLRVCIRACDSLEGTSCPVSDTGLERTLEVAGRLAVELIDAVDELERLAKVGPIYGPKDAA